MLLHLSKAVHRRSSEELLGMRLRQFLVLSYLNERSPSRQQDLCETLMLDANNCVLLLNELEDAGWTQRTRGSERNCVATSEGIVSSGSSNPQRKSHRFG